MCRHTQIGWAFLSACGLATLFASSASAIVRSYGAPARLLASEVDKVEAEARLQPYSSLEAGVNRVLPELKDRILAARSAGFALVPAGMARFVIHNRTDESLRLTRHAFDASGQAQVRSPLRGLHHYGEMSVSVDRPDVQWLISWTCSAAVSGSPLRVELSHCERRLLYGMQPLDRDAVYVNLYSGEARTVEAMRTAVAEQRRVYWSAFACAALEGALNRSLPSLRAGWQAGSMGILLAPLGDQLANIVLKNQQEQSVAWESRFFDHHGREMQLAKQMFKGACGDLAGGAELSFRVGADKGLCLTVWSSKARLESPLAQTVSLPAPRTPRLIVAPLYRVE